ncbi:MAG: hypothetical protein HDS73_00725 [Bacteroidales bacterium]|nr:hypothetical protein [Bacteroidales bacterium]
MKYDDDILNGLVCPKCHVRSVIKEYDNEPKQRRVCEKCGAFVGCHPGTERAMGILATPSTRSLRKIAHGWFDSIWRNKLKRSRYNAYSWLSLRLNMNKNDVHIGMFEEAECRKVIIISASYIKKKNPELYDTLKEKYGDPDSMCNSYED